MNDARLSHPGIVQAIEGREALVVVDTGGCSACGHGSSCGVGQVAKGLPATVLRVPATRRLRVGEHVTVSVPVRALTLQALLGYVWPAIGLMVGAGMGNATGSDTTAIVGAVGGFLGAMAVGRVALRVFPALRATPRLDD